MNPAAPVTKARMISRSPLLPEFAYGWAAGGA